MLEVQNWLKLKFVKFTFQDLNETAHQYFYPSVRKGPIDVSKAQSLVNWEPTPWHQMIEDTVAFYESAMRNDDFNTQRDEIIQVYLIKQFLPYQEYTGVNCPVPTNVIKTWFLQNLEDWVNFWVTRWINNTPCRVSKEPGTYKTLYGIYLIHPVPPKGTLVLQILVE